MSRAVSLIAIAFLLSAPASADDRLRQAGGNLELMSQALADRLMLENNRCPMKLGVSLWGKHVRKVGMTRNAIALTARSRLRTARLYNASGKPPFSFPTLYVDVGVVGSADEA